MFKPFAGLFALFMTGPALAVPITLNNPSFEAPTLADGTHQSGGSGWTFAGPASGTFNPSNASYLAGAPNGNNVAFIENGSIIQVSSELLAPDRTYRIRFAVGNRSDNPLGPSDSLTLAVFGYQNTRIAKGMGAFSTNISPPAVGTFAYQDFTFTTTSATPGLGLPVAVQLIASPTPSQFNVDDFSLEVSTGIVQRSVPVDQPIALLGLGLLVTVTAGYALARNRV